MAIAVPTAETTRVVGGGISGMTAALEAEKGLRLTLRQ